MGGPERPPPSLGVIEEVNTLGLKVTVVLATRAMSRTMRSPTQSARIRGTFSEQRQGFCPPDWRMQVD